MMREEDEVIENDVCENEIEDKEHEGEVDEVGGVEDIGIERSGGRETVCRILFPLTGVDIAERGRRDPPG